jgi:hypothetical protein
LGGFLLCYLLAPCGKDNSYSVEISMCVVHRDCLAVMRNLFGVGSGAGT